MMVGAASTPSSKIQRAPLSTPGGPKVCEEKIRVTVRVRPLNQKEQAMYDLVAWDCTDEQTIVSKNPNHERPTAPYTFDKVFGPTCSNLMVYEDGAKDVALSVLTGINATIFAYGQTSSGKTFTMKGITDNAVKDIYEHIKNTTERDFVLKLSALEIYNETVVDLLNRESGNLRLLDDPEKGTIVEKLVEELVKDGQHLRHLISICEAQRQVGETALNDRSSRSHQIIRLTLQSSLRENSGCVKSFIASLNLVDLAGSERVSQTNAGGTRLKEGSHINRSLLTLTTVIRKLSGGKRIEHIPYRDSKLTRILRPSLGGNARTAIICTISPGLSHVEQSKNTLSFATSAKEVTNTAQVNMVVSDKKLVKHLQKEVARLEAELRSPEPSSSACLRTLIKERDLKIQQSCSDLHAASIGEGLFPFHELSHGFRKEKTEDASIEKLKMIAKKWIENQMEKDMKDLKRQRDHAQSQLEEAQSQLEEERKARKQHGGHQAVKCLSFTDENEEFSGRPTPKTRRKVAVGRPAIVRQSATSTDPSMLMHEIRKIELQQKQLGEEANRALEVIHKEVVSHRLGSEDAVVSLAKMLSEIKDMQVVRSIPEDIMLMDKAILKEEITRLNSQGNTIDSLERKLENVEESIDKLVCSFPSTEETPEPKAQLKKKRILPFGLSNRGDMPNLIRSPCSPVSSWKVMEREIENRTPGHNNIVSVGGDPLPGLHEAATPRSVSVSRESTPVSQRSNSVNMKKMQRMFKNAAEENIRSIRAYVTELKERVAKLQYQKQLLVCQVLELETNEAAAGGTDMIDRSPVPWHLMFESQRKQIIMLWHLCHISIVRRTQFFLLFKGDPADQIYLEVELRRLTWLEQHLSELGNASPALLGDEPASYVSSSIKALKHERECLAKRVSLKLTEEEIEMLYIKWEIPAVGKQRRLQLVNKLWTDPHNIEHIQESADIVAKLVGFCESGEHVSKEMFELNFVSHSDRKPWMGWNFISNLFHL